MKASSYLELNWLAKADKDILLPIVVFADIQYEGYLCKPEKKEVLIDGRYYSLNRGIIVMNDMQNDDDIPATLAHEWRHLWQFYNSFVYDGKDWNTNDKISYRKRIIEFFTTSYHEYDALLFELNKSPYDLNREWHEWIIKR